MVRLNLDIWRGVTAIRPPQTNYTKVRRHQPNFGNKVRKDSNYRLILTI